MGRRVEPSAVSRCLQDRGESRGGGTFAVRPRDQHAREAALRIPQCFREYAHMVEIELAVAAELVSKGEKMLDGALVRRRSSFDIVEFDHESLEHSRGRLCGTSVLNLIDDHEIERTGDEVLHLLAMDHRIEHAVLEQELGALEALRQLLANGLLDDARSC